MRIQLSSTAFKDGQRIPDEHAFEDEDISPDLQWSGVPSTAKSLALICDDPDAPNGMWVHWVLYDLTPSMNALPAGLPKAPLLDLGAKQGLNDYKLYGYGGPLSAARQTAPVFFKLYALDVRPELTPGLAKADLVKVMDGHIMAEGQLMGTYQREETSNGQAA